MSQCLNVQSIRVMYCASSHHTGAGSPLPRRAKPGASTNWLMTRIYPQKKSKSADLLLV
ncbi:protein of unknown function [Lactiplantibacillus plantarum]